MPHDIFICYSRSDRETADKLVGRLRAVGWSVFQDVEHPSGRRWHKEIERELHAARAVVVLWSAVSRDSDFVLEEAEYGKRKDILFRFHRAGGISLRLRSHPDRRSGGLGWRGRASGLQPTHRGLDLATRRHRASAGLASSHAGAGARNFRGPGRPSATDSGTAAGPLMVVIPAGSFLMGSPPDEPEGAADEGPQHPVRIARPFAMGVHVR